MFFVKSFFPPFRKKNRPTRTSSDWFRDVLGRRIFRIFFSSFFRWQKCVCVSVCMCAWCYKPIREIRSAESFFWWLCGPTFANQVPRRSHTHRHTNIFWGNHPRGPIPWNWYLLQKLVLRLVNSRQCLCGGSCACRMLLGRTFRFTLNKFGISGRAF